MVSGEVLTRLEVGAPIVDVPHRQIRHCYGWLTVNEAGEVCVGTMREGGHLTVLSEQNVGGATCLNYAFIMTMKSMNLVTDLFFKSFLQFFIRLVCHA